MSLLYIIFLMTYEIDPFFERYEDRGRNGSEGSHKLTGRGVDAHRCVGECRYVHATFGRSDSDTCRAGRRSVYGS